MNQDAIIETGTQARSRKPGRSLAFRFAPWLLALAACLTVASAAAQDWRYRARPGDTLWDLSGKYLRRDVPWQRLQAHNGIDDPRRLPPGTLMKFPIAWLRQQPARARVIALYGDATAVDRRGASSPIREGMSFGIGTHLRTAADANLTLQFADGSRLLLQADSELVLDKLSALGATGMADTRLRLSRGRVTNTVKRLHGAGSHFIIETPHVTSSVRGTRFRIGSDGAHSQAEVLEGSVAVSGGGGERLLRPGEGTASGDDHRPMPVRALLAAPDPASIVVDSQQLPARLAWTAVPGAVRYRVQLSTTPDFLRLAFDRVVPTNAVALDAVADGDYSVRVRAIDADAVEGQDALAHARVASPAPFTLAPTENERIDAARPRFRWTGLGDHVRYRLQLAGAAGFAQPLLDVDALSATDWRAKQALPPGDYAWRVAAVGADGRATGFSDEVRFQLVPEGSGPAAQAGDARGDDGALHVRWPAAGDAQQRFRFQLARRANFADPVVDREVSGNEIALPEIRSGTWYARVQRVETDGYAGAFGPAQRVKLGCRSCRWALGGGGVLLLLAL